MLLYYIRHGEPIYDPDSLTEHGKVQAEVLSEKLRHSGLDKIYASTSKRAMQTAEPTCKAVGMEAELLDFANEHHAWMTLTMEKEDGTGNEWLFQEKRSVELFTSPEIRALGDRWYEHPFFAGHDYKGAIERVYREADAFLSSLGYDHIRYTGKYVAREHNDKRVALFAHQGFGLAFLSCLLDIPYPAFSTHFDMCHTGVTVIEFLCDEKGMCIPKILTLSNDSHLCMKNVPSNYPKF